MAARTYEDFTLELRGFKPDSDMYEVAVVPSTSIGEPEPVPVQLKYAELQVALKYLERKVADLDDLIALGEQLTARLLPEPIGALFKQFVQGRDRDTGVRLRLIARHPQLARMPWEYCYLPLSAGARDRGHFLVLNPRVSLVRHVPLEQARPPAEIRDPGQLRLLAAFANVDGFAELDLQRERKVVEKALRDFDVDGTTVELTALEQATREAVQAALNHKADIFHFAGHGKLELDGFDFTARSATGGGVLMFAADEGTAPDRVPAGDLALMLQAAGVRLAVLGACKSARQDGVSPWSGIAPALIGREIPAVVAMQYNIQDPKAVAFSGAFYTALAAGLSIDEAVAAGRQVVLGKSGEDDVEWGVPVLYMRSFDGVLFPRPAGRPSRTAQQIRDTVTQIVETIDQGGKVTGIKVERAAGGIQFSTLSVHQEVGTVSGELTGISIGTLGGDSGRAGEEPGSGDP